jgi:ABC-type dipeptide/oligopeptide/nickel transport system permease component
MGRHIIERLIVSVPVLLGVLLIGFLLLQVVPSDPAAVIAGPTASQDEIVRVLQGDFGRSFISNTAVSDELLAAFGPTLELMVASLVWAVPLGILLGTLAAVRRGRLTDRAIMAFSVAGVSMPIFWFGLMLIWIVGFKLNLLPFQGRAGPLWTIDGLRAIALPAITLGGVFVGPIARMTRTSVLEVLGADYVRTARAKGAGEGRVVVRHALRNALIPIVTLIGLQIGFLLGGAVVTETMFAWPGLGRLAVGAIVSTDMPLAQGAIMILALAFLLVNLGVDVLYAYLDPRVKRA